MFGKKTSPEEELPVPPTTEEILEDLNKAGPDDVVFTTNIGDLSANLDSASRNFQLQKRFQVRYFWSFSIFDRVFALNYFVFNALDLWPLMWLHV